MGTGNSKNTTVKNEENGRLTRKTSSLDNVFKNLKISFDDNHQYDYVTVSENKYILAFEKATKEVNIPSIPINHRSKLIPPGFVMDLETTVSPNFIWDNRITEIAAVPTWTSKNEGFQILVDLPCENLDAEYYEQVFDHIHKNNNDLSK